MYGEPVEYIRNSTWSLYINSIFGDDKLVRHILKNTLIYSPWISESHASQLIPILILHLLNPNFVFYLLATFSSPNQRSPLAYLLLVALFYAVFNYLNLFDRDGKH